MELKNLKREMPKAVFFDYGGTLDAPGVAWKEQFLPIYEKHGVRPERHKFAQAFYASDDSLCRERPTHMSLTQIVHEQVSRVLKNLGCFDPLLKDKIAQDFLARSFKNIWKNIDIIKTLRKTFKTGIISNNYGNLEAICRETGLYEVMDVLVDSTLVGKAKPHPRIFRAALDALGLLPSQAVMVGDNVKRDITGALDMGMGAVLISSGRLPQDISIPPVPVISDLNELHQILGE